VAIADWPYGRDTRTTAQFEVVRDARRGERVVRLTLNPSTQRWNKPKYTTYGATARIVEGDDGRTYVLLLVQGRSHISVVQSNLDFQEEAIFPDDPRYPALLALLAD
jgi:hypothetical protein